MHKKFSEATGDGVKEKKKGGSVMLEPPVSVSSSQTSKSRKLTSQPKQRLVIEKAHEPYQEKEMPRIEIEKGDKAEPVPRELLEQWDRGNRAMRKPTYVQGDNIKERVKGDM